jgi:starch synthase
LLDTLLRTRQHQLNGVANGIDTIEWNPAADEHIPANYSLDDMSGGASNPFPFPYPPLARFLLS